VIDSSELHDDVPTLKATIASMFETHAKLMADRDALAAELDAVLAAYTALRCKGSFNVTASDWIAFDAVVRPVVLAADKRSGKPPFDPSPDPEWSAKFEASLSPVDRLRMCSSPVTRMGFEMRVCDDCGMTHQATVFYPEVLKPGTPCFRCGSTTGYRAATEGEGR